MARALTEGLVEHRRLPVAASLKVRYLEYDPGTRLIVQYRVDAAGQSRDLVVDIGRSACEIAELVEQSPECSDDGAIGDSVVALDDLGAVGAWYPVDLGLPILATPESIAELLDVEPAGAERLAWVPQRRAVLGYGRAIVKVYDTVCAARSAADALSIFQDIMPTAALLAAPPDCGLVAQRRLAGRPLARGDAATTSEIAAGLLRRLHDAVSVDERPLSVVDPDVLLQTTSAPRRLVSFAAPDLAARLARLAGTLIERRPNGLDLVPSHGDFNLGQLFETADGVVVLDADTLCSAPRAFDVASYAANLISGRRGDFQAAGEALISLSDAYRRPIPGLDWYLAAMVMRRIDRPLRRLKRGWRDRTEEMISGLEARLGVG